jgi:hypothetical protein
MALSFPLSPSIGQIYIAPNGVTYVWNGTYWAAKSSEGGGSGGGGSGGSPITVLNDGTVISTSATVFNFTGTNLSATGENNAVIVTVNTGSTLVNGTYTVSLANDGGFVLPYGAQLFDNGQFLTITPVNTASSYNIQIVPSPTNPNPLDPLETPNDIHVQAGDPSLGIVLGTSYNRHSYVSVAGSSGSNYVSIGTYDQSNGNPSRWWFSTRGLTKFPAGYTFPNNTGTSGQSLVLDTDGLTLVWTTASGSGITLHYWTENNSVIDSTQTAVTSLIVTGTQTNIDAVIQPQGAGASLADSTGNKRGAYATDWQKQRGSASQVASGDYSIISGGSFNAATGLHSVVVGGNNNLANSNYSTIVGGHGGTTRGITGAVVFPGYATGGVESSQGVMQSAIYNIGAITSNSTPVRMSTDGNPTPTANNQIGIGDRSVAYFKGTVIAKEDAISNACIWAWDFKGVLRQDVGAITTDFVPAGVAPALSTITNTTTVANLILDLDNVTGCMIIEAVGPVGKTVRWTGKIETVEVTDNS